MTQAMYVGVANKARKVKSIYVGVNGVARKVKKVYVGDANGKARLCYTSSVTVTIVQSANQTITVTCGGKNYTSTFTADYGATYTAKVVANTGYNAGTISSASGTLTGNITISATAATIKTFTVTIVQPSGGNIVVTYNGTNYTSTFKANYNSTISCKCNPNSGYKFTSWNVSSANSLSVNSLDAPITEDMGISAELEESK